MYEYNFLLLIVTVIVILLCLAVTLYERLKSRKIMKTLNQMLDFAMDGSFTEHSFDETLLSLVESKMNRYLSASVVSSRNLMTEKDKIKELLADISHQTKTPIANILLYAQLLEEQELTKESRDCAAALRGQAEKLNFLIASLVKLSRLETGVITLHPMLHNVSPMLEETVIQLTQKAKQKNLSLTANGTNALGVFDYKWTTEALCNLLDNAIKYTPAGGSIQISVKEYELFCCIQVADSGMGIAESEITKIFSRFYRSPAVSDQEGVGIGLYLTRQILAEPGGYIKVTSSLGKGSVFSVYLPRET